MGNCDHKKSGPVFQFSLGSMLLLTTAFAVLFGVFRWAEISVWASLLVTLLFIVSLTAGFALIVAMLHSLDDENPTDRE
jgi:hypothetical protein